MADGGFKFSRLGGGDRGLDDQGSREAFAGDIEIATPDETTTNSMPVVMGGAGGRGPTGPVKAVRKTTLLLMALVAVICLLSVVISGLALSRVMSLTPVSDKVWTFAIGEGNLNLHYVDQQTLQMDGFDVDVVEMVCKLANKKCRIVTDVYSNCWKSQKGESARGGDGLMGGWYDACVGWAQTPERRRTFAFTESYTKPMASVFFVLPTSQFDSSNLAGKRIGFLDGYADDEHCLNKQDGIQNLPLQTDQIFHFASPQAAEQALADNTIDAVYTTKFVSFSELVAVKSGQFNCSTRGHSVMTRMDSDLPSWWNKAWSRLWVSKSYHLVCQTLEIRHGRFDVLPYQDICLHT